MTMDRRHTLVAEAYSSLGGAVYGYILKRTGNAADSEDLLQDVFLNLLQSDIIFSESSISRLIYRIARNRVIDWLRRHALSEKAAEYFAFTSPVSADSVEDHVAAREVMALEASCIAGMPGKRAETYLMYVHRGCSVREISAILEISPRTVENHLFNARKMMRAEFARRSVGLMSARASRIRQSG